jgi:hypothetical protein
MVLCDGQTLFDESNIILIGQIPHGILILATQARPRGI